MSVKRSVVMVLISALFILAGCAQQQNPEAALAKKIVIDYYTALNNKDYQTMYDLMSEGFKQIEPTAATYEIFVASMSKFFDTANGIHVTSTKATSATLTEIVVDYVAVIELKNGRSKELKSSFTVRKKPEGWKLIHPYGDKIDFS